MTKEKIIGGTVLEWDTEIDRGAIFPCGTENRGYDRQQLKTAITASMERGQNSSWACGNEEELKALASMAGLGSWVQNREQEFDAKGGNDEKDSNVSVVG